MYKFFGWLNVILLGLLISPYILNSLNRRFFNIKNSEFRKIIKYLRNIHKPLGLALLASGILHWYLGLGKFKIHTGSILYTFVFITAALGGSFYRLKKKNLFVLHRTFALITVGLFLFHLLFPKALAF